MLADTEDFSVKVIYGSAPGLDNVTPAGFEAEAARLWRVQALRGYIGWDFSQWKYAHSRHSDVLVLTWNTRYLSLVPSLLRARRHRVKTLLWGHGYSRRESIWRRWLRSRIARLADGVIFYSRRDADRFAEETGRYSEVFVAKNSLDQDPIRKAAAKWNDDAAALAAFRSRHNLEDRPTILFVSRFKPDNRIDLLIQAAARLRNKYDRLAVVLIGKGAEESGVNKQAAQLGISDSLRIVGPLYEEEELAPWFITADVFCYPSNLGLSALHAFGYGLPIVTDDDETRSPPEWQVVVDGKTGLKYRHGEISHLVEALDKLLENEDLRIRLGAEGRRQVQEGYSMEEMVAGLRDAIDHCLKKQT